MPDTPSAQSKRYIDRCDCETAATEREGFRPVMGDGGPCMSCGGNDGYGPAPHHKPDCYFASWEDEAHVG